MRCDVVIVSRRKDLAWLCYALQFWNKNWQEPDSRIIVRLEEDCREIVNTWGVRNVDYRYVKPWPDGYTFQMFQKMVADDYTDADLLLMADSDLMVIKPLKLEDLLVEGKPVIEYTDWDRQTRVAETSFKPREDSADMAEKIWRPCTSKILGMDVDRNYMISMPVLYWRDTFSLTRRRIVNANEKGFFDSVYSDVPFSTANFDKHPMKFADYLALSTCAVKFQGEKYVLKHLSERDHAKYQFRQFWSHGDWTPEVRAFLDTQLRIEFDQSPQVLAPVS